MALRKTGPALLGLSYYGHRDLWDALMPKDKRGNPTGVPYKTYLFFRNEVTNSTIDENPLRKVAPRMVRTMRLFPLAKI